MSKKKEWKENDKLNTLIYDCISIENNIKEIYKIKEKIVKFNSVQYFIKFYPEEEGVNKYLETIKNFGKIDIKLEEKDNDVIIKILLFYSLKDL